MTDDELLDRLQEYPQVGEKRAEEIVDVVRSHDGGDMDSLRENLENAKAYFDNGDTGYGMKFFNRALAEVQSDG